MYNEATSEADWQYLTQLAIREEQREQELSEGREDYRDLRGLPQWNPYAYGGRI